MSEKRCFNCNSSENEIPVVNLQFKGNELWICPQCIPNLIHHPEIVQSSLANVEKNQ